MLTKSERDELMDLIITSSINADTKEMDQERIGRLRGALDRVTYEAEPSVRPDLHSAADMRLIDATTMLDRAEREYLSAHGWMPDYKTGRWTAPKGYQASTDNPQKIYDTTRHAVNSQRKRLREDQQNVLGASALEFTRGWSIPHAPHSAEAKAEIALRKAIRDLPGAVGEIERENLFTLLGRIVDP